MDIERKHLKVFGSWVSKARGVTPSIEKPGRKMTQIELSRVCGGKNISTTESGANEPRLAMLIKIVHHTGEIPDKALWDDLYEQLMIYEKLLEAAADKVRNSTTISTV